QRIAQPYDQFALNRSGNSGAAFSGGAGEISYSSWFRRNRPIQWWQWGRAAYPLSGTHARQYYQWPAQRCTAWAGRWPGWFGGKDRKSTRLNSSHVKISYAVFCLKKKTSQN